MPKRIDIPKPVTFVDDNGEHILEQLASGEKRPVTQTFAEFVRNRTRDPKFGSGEGLGLDDIEAGLELRRAVTQAVMTDAAYVDVPNEHHARLLRVIEKPTGGWQGLAAEQLVPFMRAVKDAKEAPATAT